MFSARGQSADDVIVDEASSLARTGRVIVVSNDLEVRERCRAVGCEVSGSENLLQQMPGTTRRAAQSVDEDDDEPSLSTIKRGNPRRLPKKSRRPRDVRF
jgi:predicted RNA-binding protein with PIN domain